MADNPFAARPDAGADDRKYAKCPPDMPRGDRPEDKLARLKYWLDRGNANLIEIGRHDCRWFIRNGELRLETIA